ncbi:heavy metal translocating P-type ATPase [Helcococcus ovis]|uniref:Heavy metal translocating P-type ATPase n=1 Tax=Helcococcus ovis TaxID=72026 RepID=A0A4R9C2J6_9FIRM|nr:heavy metal translocating P-type ATPase [Helcococcus ovis]TFF66251.1 heavy metal translocating P-type ATPase [Helcococcus ovis]TFF67270.1 heavy metal translocating P-type ATPase [Helcococcus ovis]
MLNYLFKEKQGRFLLLGILFTVIGFILEFMKVDIAKYFFYIAMIFLGYYAIKNTFLGSIKDKKLNVDLLMILAAFGAVLINYESEGTMLLLIFAGAEVLENYISGRSVKEINELIKHVPQEAKVLNVDGTTKIVNTDDLQIGDICLISKGDQLPIDGIVDRTVSINESSLTGEAMPVTKEKGREVFAGTINEGNSFNLVVSKLKKDTVFSNIIKMVENAQNKTSKREKMLEKLEGKYVISVLVFVPLFIIMLYYFRNMTFEQAFYRGMVLLTVASPCALVASATPATLSAISNSAKNGILFKDSRAMELLGQMDILATDKTGTLTNGEFEVIEYVIPDELLKAIVYIEQNSNHPIADGILKKFENIKTDGINFQVQEVAGCGLKMENIKIGDFPEFKTYKDEKNFLQLNKDNNTISFISKDEEIVGYITLADTIRETSLEAINNFTIDNVDVQMLTGDNDKVAKKIASQLNIKNYVANCFPEDKLKYINDKISSNKTVAMIGDGINDAPSLANSDIGIGMGSGSSIAMESSDIVIVKNDLNKLYHSFKLSKKLSKIIKQNMIFSISVIIMLIGLNLFGILDLPTGVIFHESSTILVILNGLRLLKFK